MCQLVDYERSKRSNLDKAAFIPCPEMNDEQTIVYIDVGIASTLLFHWLFSLSRRGKKKPSRCQKQLRVLSTLQDRALTEDMEEKIKRKVLSYNTFL